MISYLLGAIQDTIFVDEKPKPKKEEVIVVEEYVPRKKEVFKSSALPRSTVPAFRPRELEFEVRPSYIQSEYTYSRQCGWVCYNDERLIPMIQSFSELEIMPRAHASVMSNLFLKNLEKIVLIYLFRGGEREEEKLNILMAELKNYCGGVVHLVLLADRPVIFDTMLPKKADQFKAIIERTPTGEVIKVDQETHNRIGNFVKPETLHAKLDFQPDFNSDFSKSANTFTNLKPDFTNDYLTVTSAGVNSSGSKKGETVKSSGAPGKRAVGGSGSKPDYVKNNDIFLDTLNVKNYGDFNTTLSYTPNTAYSNNPGSATYNYTTDYTTTDYKPTANDYNTIFGN